MDEISLIDNDTIPEEIKKEQNKNENKQQGVKGKVLLFFSFDIVNCIRILSPHLRWGTRWSRSFA